MTVTTITDAELTPKDYASDQEVRWCPGCGDYAILKAVQKALAELGAPRERTVFVSGIGCAARFPYYLSTYGFHTIHGRAPAIATGIKLANPELDEIGRASCRERGYVSRVGGALTNTAWRVIGNAFVLI